MFAEPTINDFLELIDWHIARATDCMLRAVNQVAGEFTGAFHGSRRVLCSIEAALTEFEAGVDATLGELKRVITKTARLDPHELRQAAAQRLENFAVAAKDAARVDRYRTEFQGQLAAFDQYLRFALRQFDVGFLDPSEPEVPPVANSINIGTMTGSVIQQGSPGATQTVNLNIEGALAALHTFESELSKVQIDGRTMNDLAADIATIKAQLSKPSPSVGILQEAGKSLRNVVESIAAGVLTSEVVAAAIALANALGLK
jgi:hypothetical protein